MEKNGTQITCVASNKHGKDQRTSIILVARFVSSIASAGSMVLFGVLLIRHLLLFPFQSYYSG